MGRNNHSSKICSREVKDVAGNVGKGTLIHKGPTGPPKGPAHIALALQPPLKVPQNLTLYHQLPPTDQSCTLPRKGKVTQTETGKKKTGLWLKIYIRLSSVQVSRSVVSNSLQLYGLQHARLPCPSATPEPTQTHVHRIDDAIQPSHPLYIWDSKSKLDF